MGKAAVVGDVVSALVAVAERDYKTYGCARCGYKKAYWIMAGPGYVYGKCSSCDRQQVVVADGMTCPIKIVGDGGALEDVLVVEHPENLKKRLESALAALPNVKSAFVSATFAELTVSVTGGEEVAVEAAVAAAAGPPGFRKLTLTHQSTRAGV